MVASMKLTKRAEAGALTAAMVVSQPPEGYLQKPKEEIRGHRGQENGALESVISDQGAIAAIGGTHEATVTGNLRHCERSEVRIGKNHEGSLGDEADGQANDAAAKQ